MAVSHLADTSALARLGNPDVRAAVEPLAAEGRLSRSTIVDLEIGHSARNERVWDDLHHALRAFQPIELEPHHLRRACQVQRALAASGLRGRKVPDLLIAACAEDHGLVVLHYDADFDHIASVTGQAVEWVVPAGTVD